MKPWELLDRAPVPGADTTLELLRRDREIVIRVNGRHLMSDREHGSEEALAELACGRIAGRAAPRVLIGGLGMGFTLAAALRVLGPAARVVVAELVPAVVRWNRGVAGEAAGQPLADPRASVYEGDVADQIHKPPQAWDAILLDVDNGPSGLTRSSNESLYSPRSLEAVFDALQPAGVFGVWSAAPDHAFTRRVHRAGFDVEAVRVRSRGAKGGQRHVVWIGQRRATPPAWRRGRVPNRGFGDGRG